MLYAKLRRMSVPALRINHLAKSYASAAALTDLSLEIAAGDLPVTFRTLDLGGDKVLPYMEAEREENPALGVRGFRIAKSNAELVGRQLDAIAEAGLQTGNAPWVMAPMIATADEARRFADLARDRGLFPGVMIEVPAAALLADKTTVGGVTLTQCKLCGDCATGCNYSAKESLDTNLHGLLHNQLIGRGGHHHHGHRSEANILANQVQHLDAIDLRHADVGDDQIRLEALMQSRHGGTATGHFQWGLRAQA